MALETCVPRAVRLAVLPLGSKSSMTVKHDGLVCVVVRSPEGNISNIFRSSGRKKINGKTLKTMVMEKRVSRGETVGSSSLPLRWRGSAEGFFFFLYLERRWREKLERGLSFFGVDCLSFLPFT